MLNPTIFPIFGHVTSMKIPCDSCALTQGSRRDHTGITWDWIGQPPQIKRNDPELIRWHIDIISPDYMEKVSLTLVIIVIGGTAAIR